MWLGISLFLVICTPVFAELSLEDVLKRLKDIESRESEVKQTLLVQDEKIRLLEASSSLKDKRIGELEARIESLQTDLNEYKEHLEEADGQDVEENDDSNEHMTDIAEILREESETEKIHKHHQQGGSLEIKSPTKGRAAVGNKRLVVDPEVPVAFHAVMKRNMITHITTGQNVVFDTELLNVGNGYHSEHGVFIAPYPGIYVFSVSILSYVDPHPEAQVDLVRNNIVLAKVYVHGDSGRHDQGSVTATVQLDAGDEVWAQTSVYDDTTIWGGRLSSFTGFLLMPL